MARKKQLTALLQAVVMIPGVAVGAGLYWSGEAGRVPGHEVPLWIAATIMICPVVLAMVPVTLFPLRDAEPVRRYMRVFGEPFFALYLFALANCLASDMLFLRCLAIGGGDLLLSLLAGSATNNIFQTLAIIVIIARLSGKALPGPSKKVQSQP